jgi:hypothetical protein
VVGLEGVRAEIAMVETPDGHGRLEQLAILLDDATDARLELGIPPAALDGFGER